MIGIFAWAAIVVFVPVLVGLLLLAVPVELTFRVARGDGTRPRVGVRWMFGLVSRDVGALKEKTSEPEPQASAARPQFGAFLQMVSSGAAFTLVGIGWRLMRKVELREFVLRARFGTGDPGETGILYGVSSAITGPANRRRNVDVQLSPSYAEAVLEGEMHGRLRVVPIRLLFPLIGFFVRPSNVRAYKQLRRGGA